MSNTKLPLLQIDGTVHFLSDDDDDNEDENSEINDYERLRRCTYAVNSWSRSSASTTGTGSSAHPVLIAVVKNHADVVTCLQYAAANKLQVCTRSGGHNWFGSFLQSNTLLLDLSHLNSIRVNAAAGTAVVGPSSLGQDVNEAAAAHKYCFPTGHCPGVPVGGFLLGGGFGWFSEYYGISAESVVGCTIVTAAGETVYATQETHAEDWMWLCRGAGSAFPGVVTEFTLKLHPLPAIVRSRSSIHAVEDYGVMAEYLRAGRLSGSIPNGVEASLVLVSTPPPLADVLKVPKVCIVGLSILADNEDEYLTALATVEAIPSTPLLPYEPAKDFTFSGLCEPLRPVYPAGFSWMVNSHLLSNTKPLDWDGIRDAFLQTPNGLSNTLTVIGPCNDTAAPGAYGPVPSPGIIVGTYAVYQDEADIPVLRKYMGDSAVHTEQQAVKFNVLEHVLNAETASRVFVGETGVKLAALRAKLDPDHLFFDITKMQPRE